MGSEWATPRRRREKVLQGRSSGGRWDFSIRVKSGFDAALWQGAGGRIPQEGGPLDQGGPSKPGRPFQAREASLGRLSPRTALAYEEPGPNNRRAEALQGGRGGRGWGWGPTGRGKRG